MDNEKKEGYENKRASDKFEGFDTKGVQVESRNPNSQAGAHNNRTHTEPSNHHTTPGRVFVETRVISQPSYAVSQISGISGSYSPHYQIRTPNRGEIRTLNYNPYA